jgi:hypothetical protein
MNKKRDKALTDPMTQDRHWHLDRRVPLAMITAIMMQTGVFIWWAAQLSERVNTLERGAITTAPNSERITRMEVRLEGIGQTVQRIERLIEMKNPNN